MAAISDLPCNGEGVCMVCKATPSDGELLTCKTCATPWHGDCLRIKLKTLAEAAAWECPDCSDLTADAVPKVGGGDGLVEKIRAIENDETMTDQEKAKRRQELMGGGPSGVEEKRSGEASEMERFNCSICMHLLERPVSTPCGHNFCLKCFQKMVSNGKPVCAFCRREIPTKMAREPRINSAIVMAIRMAKASQSSSSVGAPKINHYMHNSDRPEKAFTTERAKKTGKANACSGKIFVTIPLDHFGPITAENDPDRKQGVLVGESWEDRMECRQWGAHFPHVAGISGQSDHGAQSVALSGGYEDDEDNGEWFLYTGSGGRDLSGNKRTNKKQSFDQTFHKYNKALRVSCIKGYPVRVVRSHKEKRSSYAPQGGVRYDGIYRIEKCWRKPGKQGFLVCRYLFVRCDNEPAPWTSDTVGDRPRPLPVVGELKNATDVTERKTTPAWDFDEEQGRWVWKKAPPESRKACDEYDEEGKVTRKRKRHVGEKDRLRRDFGCHICKNVMVLPVTTPCAHNFCKACLEGAFAGQSFQKERKCGGTRTLRTQKSVMRCPAPSCTNDISDFVRSPQVNHELTNMIDKLKEEIMDTEDVPEESGDTDEAVEDEVTDNGENAEEDAGLNIIIEDGLKETNVKDDAPTEIVMEDKPLNSDGVNGISELTVAEAKPVEVEAKSIEAEAKPVETEEKPVKTKRGRKAAAVEAEEKPVEIEEKPVKTKRGRKAAADEAEEKSAEAEEKPVKAKRGRKAATEKSTEAEEKSSEAEAKSTEAEEKSTEAEEKPVKAKRGRKAATETAVEAEAKSSEAEAKSTEAEEKSTEAEEKPVKAKRGRKAATETRELASDTGRRRSARRT